MNRWRWLGSLFFVLAVSCLVLSARLPAHAQGKDDKGKTEEKKAEEKKAETKAEEKKAETKTEEKKTETKTEEKKVEAKAPEAKGGDAPRFKAFDEKAPPFYQELVTSTKQDLKVQGQTVAQKQDQTFVILWTPKAKDGKGNYVVTQKIVGVKMDIDIGGNKIAYDSRLSPDKQPKNPMTDFFNQLKENELTFTISPEKMEVVGIEGRDKFIKSLGDTNPQMTSLLKTILSEDALKKMAEPTWWALPPGGLEKGKTWGKDSTLNLGPIGTYATHFDFTYAGQGDKGLDKIDIKSTMKYTAPQDKAGLPFVIQKAELQSKEGGGEALFDRQKGRFESSKITMKLGGTLQIEVGNMSTDITLDQTQESTTKTHDNNPWGGDTKK